MRGKPITHEDREAAIRMRKAGYSYKMIGEVLNRTPGTVSNIISLAIFQDKLPYSREMDPAVKRKRRI